MSLFPSTTCIWICRADTIAQNSSLWISEILIFCLFTMIHTRHFRRLVQVAHKRKCIAASGAIAYLHYQENLMIKRWQKTRQDACNKYAAKQMLTQITQLTVKRQLVTEGSLTKEFARPRNNTHTRGKIRNLSGHREEDRLLYNPAMKNGWVMLADIAHDTFSQTLVKAERGQIRSHSAHLFLWNQTSPFKLFDPTLSKHTPWLDLRLSNIYIESTPHRILTSEEENKWYHNTMLQ